MFKVESYRTKDRISDTIVTLRISTVELPEEHGHGYETCVFKRNGDSEVVENYTTLADALAGHYRHAKRHRCKTIHIA